MSQQNCMHTKTGYRHPSHGIPVSNTLPLDLYFCRQDSTTTPTIRRKKNQKMKFSKKKKKKASQTWSATEDLCHILVINKENPCSRVTEHPLGFDMVDNRIIYKPNVMAECKKLRIPIEIEALLKFDMVGDRRNCIRMLMLAHLLTR